MKRVGGEVEMYDWSLTPSRYVSVALEEVDVNFEEALLSIHINRKGLNTEAPELAERITRYLEKLGV